MSGERRWSRLRRVAVWSASLLVGLGAVCVVVAWSVLATGAGARWALGLVAPEGTEIEAVRGRILGPLELRGVSVPTASFDLRVDTVRVEWRPGRLFRRVVDLTRVELAGVRASATGEPDEPTPLSGPPRLTLPLRVEAHRADLRRLVVLGAAGDTTAVLRAGHLSGVMGPGGVRVDSLRLGFFAAAANVDAEIEAAIGGEAPHPVRATLRWSGRLSDGPSLAGTGTLAGDLEDLRVEHRLTAPLAAALEARIRHAFGPPRWTATLTVPEVELATVATSLPALRAGTTVHGEGTGDSAVARATFTVTPPGEESLPGALAATWSPHRLDLDSASLRFPGRDGRLTARGSVELGADDPRTSLVAEWLRVAWPLSGEAAVASPRGRLAVSGRPTDFDLTVDASVRRPGFPSSEWHVDGRGARTGDTLRTRADLRAEVEGAPPVRSSLRGALHPGGVRVEELVARVDDLATVVRARGEVVLGEEPPRADLRFDWTGLRWPLAGEARIASSGGTLTLLGDAGSFRLSGEAALRAEPLPPGRWRADVAAGLAGDTLRARADVDARLEEVGELRASGRVTRTPERILVPDLTLRTPASAGLLRLRGELRPADDLPVVAAHAEWRNVAWPFSGEPAIRSADGTLDASRREDRLRFRIGTALQGASLPPGRWHVAGSATAAGLDADTVEAEILGGRLAGEISARRDSVVEWSASFRGRNLDPSHVRAGWPGDLAVGLAARGRWGGAEPVVSVRELSLEGELRGRSFGALLRGTLDGAEIRANTLLIRSRTASLSGSAVVADRVDASWSVDAPDLLDLLPGARGHLAMEGRAAGPRSRPRIRATALGSKLGYGDAAVDSLEADVTVDLSDAASSEALLAVRGLRAGSLRLDSARVEASGRVGGHEIGVDAAARGDRLVVGAEGGWDGAAWAGALTRLGLESARAGPWEIRAPADLFVSPDSASLASACWAGAEGRLCFGGSWAANADVRWSATGTRVPLALLAPVLPLNLVLEGSVDLETSGRLARGSPPNAELRLDARSAELRYRLAGEEERRAIDALRASAVADARGMRGDAELALADGDHLRLEAEADLPGGEERTLRARLTGNVRDRGLTEVLSGQAVLETRGHLAVDLTAAGTLARPIIAGSVRLDEAGAIVPGLGIRIDGIELEGRNDPRSPGPWLVSGSAASGRGTAAVEGSFRLPTDTAGWAIRARLTGREFEAYRTSLGHFLVSPDLRVTADETRVEVEGELGVPVGRVTAASAPAAVPTAPDVRVVAVADAPAPDPSTSPALPLSARVRVSLGQDVVVDAEGLRAELGGELTVVAEPGRPPVGNGTLDVRQGSYSAYGQRLSIDRGRIVFVQSPLDDPGLDLGIARESRGVTARMQVTGTVRRPRIALSSEPPLADDEILAYLLLGRPVNELSQREGRVVESVARSLGLSGGNLLVARLGALFGLQEARIESEGSISDASLVLGKQVLPRVQVDYAIGLLGTSNVLRIRYRLGRGWSVQTESSREVSVDLLYEIGR